MSFWRAKRARFFESILLREIEFDLFETFFSVFCNSLVVQERSCTRVGILDAPHASRRATHLGLDLAVGAGVAAGARAGGGPAGGRCSTGSMLAARHGRARVLTGELPADVVFPSGTRADNR